jgi:hypothetical protein
MHVANVSEHVNMAVDLELAHASWHVSLLTIDQACLRMYFSISHFDLSRAG